MALSLRMLEDTLCMRIRIDLRFAATVDEAVLLATIMILLSADREHPRIRVPDLGNPRPARTGPLQHAAARVFDHEVPKVLALWAKRLPVRLFCFTRVP